MSTGKRPHRAPQAPPAPPPAPKRQPEKKFGPYRNGVGVTIWLNEVQTEDGPRLMRSITIAPRRYFDREREEWRDAKSYHPHDLVLLQIALQQASSTSSRRPSPASGRRTTTPRSDGGPHARRSARRPVPHLRRPAGDHRRGRHDDARCVHRLRRFVPGRARRLRRRVHDVLRRLPERAVRTRRGRR